MGYPKICLLCCTSFSWGQNREGGLLPPLVRDQNLAKLDLSPRPTSKVWLPSSKVPSKSAIAKLVYFSNRPRSQPRPNFQGGNYSERSCYLLLVLFTKLRLLCGHPCWSLLATHPQVCNRLYTSNGCSTLHTVAHNPSVCVFLVDVHNRLSSL